MTAPAVATAEATFAGNRVRASIALRVEAGERLSRVARLREEGALRVRFPHALDACEAVIVNTAGGVAGGDRLAFALEVGPGASMSVTTAAAEKVYRSLAPPAEMSVRLDIADGGRLAWLPQETILFDRANLDRTIEVSLAGDATVLLAEALVFGRAAMGEAVEQGRCVDRWRVRRDGRLVFADTLRLEGAVAPKLAKAAVMHGGIAVATVLVAPGGEQQVVALREAAHACAGEIGISAWNGVCLGRLVAKDSAVLRADLAVLLSSLGLPLPRLWIN